VGATTRLPEELPPAIRSRCVEIFFQSLSPEEIKTIAVNAIRRIGLEVEEGVLDVVVKYATNGREAVNMVQMAAGMAITEGRAIIRVMDMEWVVSCGQYNPRRENKMPPQPSVGVVAGLAVCGPNTGTVVEIEALALPARKGRGRVTVTGVVEEEELGSSGRRIRRKSLARSAVENGLTALRSVMRVEPDNFDIHVNFPGGIPVDGPSAGVAIAVAVYSALTGIPVDNRVALTGEVSIGGQISPVGGIVPKVAAAAQAGAERVLVPQENYQQLLGTFAGVTVVGVARLEEAIREALVSERTTIGEEVYLRPVVPVRAGTIYNNIRA